jgi:hypothetical protein
MISYNPITFHNILDFHDHSFIIPPFKHLQLLFSNYCFQLQQPNEMSV